MSEVSPGLYRAGAGEPVVLLHGFTGTWHHWRPLLGELAGRYEVIAPTLAGHAGGPPLERGTMSLATAADSLEGHLSDLGIGTAHFVGNSLGGALGLELAKRGRARSLVALAPAGGWTPGDGEAKRLARFFRRQTRLTRATAPRLGRIFRNPNTRRLALRDVMRHGELVSPQDAIDMARLSLGCTVIDDAIKALRADDRATTVQDLDQIDCPVLLAWPQFDRILPVERHANRYRRDIPGVELVQLTGCGHVPMWDDTRAVLHAIIGLVDAHSSPTAAVAPGRTEAPAPVF